jgi:hypothetical protein
MKKIFKIIPTKQFLDIDINIKPSIKFIPDWYKSIKPFVNINDIKAPSIKRCVPILDSISYGYMIYTVEDIVFNAESKTFENSEVLANTHPEEQLGSYPIPEEFYKIAFKWENFLNIETPNKYSCLFAHPLHRMDLPFYTLPGVVDTDKHPLNVNFPFLMRKGFSGIIPKGTPIIQIIPVKRDSWKIKKKKNNGRADITKNFESKFKSNAVNEVNSVYKNYYRDKKEFE